MNRTLPLRSKLENVVIVGGGIGGLTASIAFAKTNQLKKVTVIEGKPTVGSKQGSGIALWRNSLRGLHQLNVKNDLEAKGRYLTGSMSYRNGKGTILAVPPAQFPDNFPILCLQRSDLHATLLHHAEANGVTIINKRVSDLSDISTIADIDIQKTLVVGADGIHSVVRRQLTAQTPIFMKYRYWRATIPSPSSIDTNEAYEIWVDKGRFGFVPLKQPEVFWFYSEPCNEEYVSSEMTNDDKKRYLVGLLSGNNMNQTVRTLVEETPASQILQTPIHKVVVKGNWCSSDGKIVLLGDACHATAPNLAQGAGLAIEDAIQLAGSFKLHSDPVAASTHYQSIRKPRARTVQTMADAIASLGHMRYPLAHIRDSILSSCPQFIAGPVFETAVSYSLGGDYTPPHL
eukprot:TRINITY_DN1015_c2_g2_i1.p1 TRINITY_DN1015_c2_g2~~TRINITY_DN1015_c2_g2_i1.p1  ORF type:complete len:401 (+),score=62.42 TRINITY_DN1015_c2_g2_i1:88-1290(+)